MNTNKNYKVILVDDHVLLRDALATLINSFDELQVVGAADHGEGLIEHFRSGLIPNLVLLDLNMPKMDGFETAQWIQKNYPEVKILVLTMYDSEIALIRLLQVGVKGFLKKDIHPSELRNALVSVAENGYYYSHNTTGKLASLFQKNHTNQSSIEKAMLSPLEIDFLKLASTELTYKEIADQMRITPRVIDSYRDSLFDKLDVKSRVGLAIYAVRNGIVSF
jgi:two-component system, NarL family, invasion response regulator UvrY